MKDSPSLSRVFEGIGIATVALIPGLGVLELASRTLLAPSAGQDVTVQAERSVAQLCTGQTDPYDKPGQCYYSQDQIALMEPSVYQGHIPVAAHSGRGYRTNVHRHRYDDDLPDKPAGEARVFVTGGSTAWGGGVQQDQIYAAVAERELSGRLTNRRARVVTAGVGAYTSLQEVMFFHNTVRNLGPDVWVMLTGWNDIYAAYRGQQFYRNPDYFEIGDKVRRLTTGDVIFDRRMARDESALPPPPQYAAYTLKLAYIIDRFLHARRVRRVVQAKSGESEKLALSPQQGAEQFLQHVAMASDLAHSLHIRFIVYLQPNLYHTLKTLTPFERELLAAYQRHHPGLADYHRAGYEHLRQKLPKLAASKGFQFLDADEAIKAEARSVFTDHCHISDRGNALIGRHLAQALTPLIPR